MLSLFEVPYEDVNSLRDKRCEATRETPEEQKKGEKKGENLKKEDNDVNDESMLEEVESQSKLPELKKESNKESKKESKKSPQEGTKKFPAEDSESKKSQDSEKPCMVWDVGIEKLADRYNDNC